MRIDFHNKARCCSYEKERDNVPKILSSSSLAKQFNFGRQAKKYRNQKEKMRIKRTFEITEIVGLNFFFLQKIYRFRTTKIVIPSCA